MDDTARMHAIEMMVKEMNRCWTAGWHEEQFRQYIHPDAVAIVPATPGRLEGRDAYVAGWRSFCEAAVIHEWKETGHKVQLYNGGKCAVVTYFFSLTFAIGAQKQTMQGRDMFFLVKEGRRWLVVADQFSPEPAGA
ncbi:MAG: nuclear transport factor 2 family protein [Methanoregula sp.]|jgi:ketosteroid isomerase-like protein|nr:nuclear transport factor 2 family protein [Methanoregula sp.]